MRLCHGWSRWSCWSTGSWFASRTTFDKVPGSNSFGLVAVFVSLGLQVEPGVVSIIVLPGTDGESAPEIGRRWAEFAVTDLAPGGDERAIVWVAALAQSSSFKPPTGGDIRLGITQEKNPASTPGSSPVEWRQPTAGAGNRPRKQTSDPSLDRRKSSLSLTALPSSGDTQPLSSCITESHSEADGRPSAYQSCMPYTHVEPMLSSTPCTGTPSLTWLGSASLDRQMPAVSELQTRLTGAPESTPMHVTHLGSSNLPLKAYRFRTTCRSKPDEPGTAREGKSRLRADLS